MLVLLCTVVSTAGAYLSVSASEPEQLQTELVMAAYEAGRGAARRRQQEELERRMRAREAEDEQFDEQVGSLKEQADALTRRLKQLYASYRTKKSERDGLSSEFQVLYHRTHCACRFSHPCA
jgi:chromosome segregation ATPase